MANLAIKGHPTRGGEVIQLLEMLGGKSNGNIKGYNDDLYYYIAKDGLIYGSGIEYEELACNYTIFTLEEFLEKFPYKVGDEVIAYAEGCLTKFTIQDIRWNYELNKVEYKICSSWLDASLIMKLYKEEIMEERDEKTVKHVFNANVISFDIAQKDKYELDLQGKFEVVLREGKYYVERIKPQYPKDYEGCCKVLGIRSDWHLTLELDTPATHDLSVTKEFDYVAKLESLRKLLICRDAYWKLAGEQMGLANPWEPDYSEEDYEQGCPIKYVIYYTGTHIRKERKCTPSYVLSFPTKEMLVSFYENFKDLINDCKELL